MLLADAHRLARLIRLARRARLVYLRLVARVELERERLEQG